MTPTFDRETPRRTGYRAVAIAWGIALLIGSLQPIRPLGIHFGFVHHTAHLLCFGALAFFAAAGFGNPGRISLWPATGSFTLCFAIEFLQHLENHMPIEWHDLGDDAIGILAFSLLFWAVDRRTAAFTESPARSAQGKMGRLVTKLVRRIRTYSRIAGLSITGRFSKSPVVTPGSPVVSLTSYGKRIKTVHVVIESIARGKCQPSALILWLDDQAVFNNLPLPLRRLEKRGLQIRLARNDGPHKKYYPYLENCKVFRLPLVTADDDVLYPSDWLEGLMDAHRQRPDVVNCYRARVIELREQGFSKYEQWPMCESTEPSFLHFATGVSGVIYPPGLLIALKEAGRAFEHCCPKADDIWLHVQALRAGYKIRQFVPKPLHFLTLPGTQDVSLERSNAYGPDAGNNRQAMLTYNESDLDRLREAANFTVHALTR